MEKMISVINENLQTVINGIKKHHEEIEVSLKALEAEMEEKNNTATSYKNDVEDAKSIISSLEDEISELVSDLEELSAKFSAKNFNEIVAAGNKEINTKISEKKDLIEEQSNLISDLTKKSHDLKEEISKIKDKKNLLEDNLNKTIILEKYYVTRISEIIDYSIDNPDGLENFIPEEPSEELIVNTKDYENLDDHSDVDGSVFEEIDEISTKPVDIDEDKIKEILEKQETEEEEEVEEEVSKEDLVVSELNEILLNTETVSEEKEEVSVENEPEEVKVEPTPTLEEIEDAEIEETITEEIAKDKESEETALIEDINTEENFNNIFKTEEEEDVRAIDEALGENKEVFPIIEEKESDAHIVLESDFNNQEDIHEIIKESGLDVSRFSEGVLAKFDKLNKESIINFVNVLKKHNLPISLVYANPDILVNVTSQNLDYILTLLTSADIDEDSISYVFDKLDQVNISKLEQEINFDNTRELTEILLPTLNITGGGNIQNMINLNDKEIKELKKSSTDLEFKIISTFDKLVFENYDTLNTYNINNLKECFIKHPHKFIMDPNKFIAMLDKYDPEDLTRCINKNSAVIDKL